MAPGPVRVTRLSWPLVLLGLASACAGPGVDATLEQDSVRVTMDGEPFATVHYEAQPRPYVFPLHGATGVPVTRSFPMAEVPGEERDHPHHQSFWFAHGDVNGFDFWHGTEHAERIVWDGDLTVEVQDEGCLVRAGYTWMVDEDTRICSEQRDLVFGGDSALRTIDVSVTLWPDSAPLVLGDTKEGSLALRLHPALRVEGELATGTLTNSSGDRDRSAWGKRARWVHAEGTVDGDDVAISILDHPENHGHPTWWHARTYGLVAANPFGAHDFEGLPSGTGDLTVPVGESLVLRYRVLLHDGQRTPEEIDATYRAWVTE